MLSTLCAIARRFQATGLADLARRSPMPRAMPWVFVGLACHAAGWVYRRAAVRHLPPRAGLSAEERRGVEAVVRARREGRQARPGAVLSAVYGVLRLRAALRATPAVMETPPPNVRALLSRARSLDSPAAEPRGRSRSLVALAGQIAPLSDATAERVWDEIYNGGIESVGGARDEALGRLGDFLAFHGRVLPEPLARSFRRALVVPHDAPHLPPVSLHLLGPRWARQSVLVYRPEVLAQPEPNLALGAPSVLALFRGLLPRDEASRPRLPNATPGARRARALLRLMLSEMVRPAIGRHWGRLVQQLDAELAPVWGERVRPEVLVDELAAAVARVLADVVWGAHMPPTYTDRLGLGQLVLNAMAQLPDLGLVLPAVFDAWARGMSELGDGVLAQAQALRASLVNAEGWKS